MGLEFRLIEETNEREWARLLDITEKKISSKKKNKKNLVIGLSEKSQDCTKKKMDTNILEPVNKFPPPLGELKGQYYMNLTALKPKRETKSNIEESDKSLAILVNMLNPKSEEELRKENLQVIEEIPKSNFNQVVRLSSSKKEGSRRKQKLNFKKPVPGEANPRRIIFVNKPVIDKQTKLITMPFQKLNSERNLILDKQRLLNHLKRKKTKRDHVAKTSRGDGKIRVKNINQKKREITKKSLSPNCALISKMRKNKMKQFKTMRNPKPLQKRVKSKGRRKTVGKIEKRVANGKSLGQRMKTRQSNQRF